MHKHNELEKNEENDKSSEEIIQNILPQKTSSMFSSILNIMNTIIGAGILTLPYIIMNFGIIFGFLLIISIYLITIYSCKLLIESKNLSNQTTNYSKLGILTMGKKGEILIKSLIFLNNFGICIIYFMIFGSSINKLIEIIFSQQKQQHEKFFLSTKFFQLIGAIIILPFSFAKSTEKLKFASILTILSVFIFTLLTVYNFFNKFYNSKLPLLNIREVLFPAYLKINLLNSLSSFSSIFIAFTFHFNFFPIYNSLDNKTDKKMIKTCIVSLSFVAIIYLIIGILGYLSYGNNININFLESFNINELGFCYYLLYFFYLFVPLFSIPLCFYEARNNFLSFFYEMYQIYQIWNNKGNLILSQKIEEGKNKENYDNFSYFYNGNNNFEKNYTFYIISFILFFFIIIFGMFINDLAIIFSFVGAIGANSIGFILPAIFYVKLSEGNNIKRKIAICLAIFGIVSGFVSLGSEILNIVL